MRHELRFSLPMASLMLVLLAACSMPPANSAAPQVQDADTSSTQPAPQPQGTEQPASTAPVDIDRSCRTDADCTVKNVGNCCGYYPSCVNVDSPTDPKGVRARCAAQGRASVCGFPTVEGCQCVAGQCENLPARAGRGKLLQPTDD